MLLHYLGKSKHEIDIKMNRKCQKTIRDITYSNLEKDNEI